MHLDLNLEVDLSTPINTVEILEILRTPPPVRLMDKLLENNQGRADREEVILRARRAEAMGLQSARDLIDTEMNGTALICGSGPSIGDVESIKLIRKLQARGAKVWSCNKTNDLLAAKGIVSDYVVLLDPKAHVSDYVKRLNPKTKCLIASQCHDETFAKMKARGADIYLYHAGQDFEGHLPEPDNLLKTEYPPTHPWICIPGSTTVGMRAQQLAYCFGNRMFHMFGMDSSFRGNQSHAVDKPESQDIAVMPPIQVKSQHTGKRATFTATNHMARQCADVLMLMEKWENVIKAGTMELFDMRFHGDGMLPTMAAICGLHADPEMNRQWSGIDTPPISTKIPRSYNGQEAQRRKEVLVYGR